MATLAPSFFIGSSSFLQVTRTTITSRMCTKFGQIRSRTAELHALDRLEKSPWTFIGRNVVAALATLFLIGFYLFLQVTRTCIKAWMRSNFCQIPQLTTELFVLECLKNRHNYNLVATQMPSFVIRSSSVLHETMTTMKTRMSSKFS